MKKWYLQLELLIFLLFQWGLLRVKHIKRTHNWMIQYFSFKQRIITSSILTVITTVLLYCITGYPIPIIFGMADFTITTTANFDAGTKIKTATETELANVNADELFMDVQAEAVKISSIGTGGGIIVGTYGGLDYWNAQSILLSADTFITALSVYIDSYVGTPTDFIMELRNDNGGEPDSLILSTEQKAYGDLDLTAFNKFTISGLPYKLSSGVTYWIVFKTVTTGPNNNYYAIAAGAYADGQRAYSSDGGSTWTQSPTTDEAFKLHSKDYAETETELNPIAATPIGMWGMVLKVDSTYHMYYTGTSGTRAHHATSSDGKTSWVDDTGNNPVIGETSWCPWVWIEDSTWYMVFSGDVAGKPAVKVAHSSDGITWTVDATILIPDVGEWDATGTENWGLMKVGSTYYLWYNNLYSTPRTVGLATTTDTPDTWDSNSFTKDVNNPIFEHADGLGMFCSCPFKRGDYYYMVIPHYTSGTDYAQVELYRDTSPTFYSSSRTYIGVVKSCDAGEWNSDDQDTVYVLCDDIYMNSFDDSENDLWLYVSGYDGTYWTEGIFIETNIDEALTLVDGEWDAATQKSSLESATQTMASGKKLSDTTITHSGLTADYYITEIQWLVGGVVKAAYSTDIVTGASTTIEEGDLTFGTFNDIDADFTIRIYFYGEHESSPVITQVEGNYRSKGGAGGGPNTKLILPLELS